MARSTGKRLRFDVFHRDHFTCQYCGMQPPDAVLVIDHITPVAAGGETVIDNLTTACEPCNQGKTDKLLANPPSRPDADLLYLNAQQEIAELRRYQHALAEKEMVLTEVIGDWQYLWSRLTGLDWAPADKVLHNMVRRYGHDITGEAVEITAIALERDSVSLHGEAWLRYMWGVARSLNEEEASA